MRYKKRTIVENRKINVLRNRQAEEWKRGECFTFKGARRVWYSFTEARKQASGQLVRRFDTETDARQWLYAVSL